MPAHDKRACFPRLQPAMLEAMNFSHRTAWETGEDAWASARRSAGPDLIDLTIANPTACGLGPPIEEVLRPLAHPGAAFYTPDPLGMLSARDAVTAYYGDHHAEVSPEHLCLTTSTSEAYSFLFRLLCDPRDEVLIARPSYPLFDLLAQLDDVVLKPYPLHCDPGAVPISESCWNLDMHALEEAFSPRTRAVVVVHPNNPTGNYVSAAERVALRQICARHNVALLVDEVFLDYSLRDARPASPLARSFISEESPGLCFVLSGLSKICALPQMKLSWIAASGPAELVREAMSRLEIIADTFLSLNAPVQFALPHWLAGRHETQSRIRSRSRENLSILDSMLDGTMASRLPTEGGWTAVLRVPSTVEGEDFAVAAIRRGVLVQPGVLYDLPTGRCVVSLLTQPQVMREGLIRLPLT